MSGFGFDPAGETALADLGLDLVEAVPAAARTVRLAPSRLADRVVRPAQSRRSGRVLTFSAARLSGRVIHLEE